MSTGIDRLASQLQKTIDEKDKGKKTGYYSQCEVLKVTEDTVWVKIPGGVDETPVSKTVNAKPGDTVQVRVEGGRAWIAGNYTSPATDDTRANTAYIRAESADEKANDAIDNASIAKMAADRAVSDADRAYQSAQIAEESATSAREDAVIAKSSADSAIESAKTAIFQLSTIEDVVGTLEWLTKHGEFSLTEDTTPVEDKTYYSAIYDYFLTEDTEVDAQKTYYTRSGAGTDEDPYLYTEVESPIQSDLNIYYERTLVGYEPIMVADDDPSELGLFELTHLNEAVSNYISSHLALTDSGLWLSSDSDSQYRILLASDGLYLYGPSGVISSFGENIVFNSEFPQRIGGDNSYIEFDPITEKLNIVSDSILLGGQDTAQKIYMLEQDAVSLRDDIATQSDEIEAQRNELENLSGYVTINNAEGYIRVGKTGSNSYVQIDGGDDSKVAINVDQNDVAYMSGERFYAPSAVVTNLYMQTALNSSNIIGAIGWVMRSNGHLSLKRIK